MENYNGKNEKKGGFWSSLSGLFRGGSSAVGGASSGLGSAGSAAGGLGGLFATKAGIVGMVLGGATIAAGVGVVYNFISPSSKGVYSPELFQNSYYEEESSKAGMARANSHDASGASASTLDMFKEQARKDGIGGLSSEAGDGEKSAADAAAQSAGAAPSADSAAPGVPGADSGAVPKLQASSGFGGKGGGGSSNTSIPRMKSDAGLSGGIGNQFQSVYRPPAGKASGMGGSVASRVNGSPKYAVPSFNKKGSYGQAKYAGKMGAKAAYSADGSGARTSAENAFSGETSGSGDVAVPGTGAGLGGAGVTNGSALKGNDPSLNSNNSTPPKVPDTKIDNPWQATEDRAIKFMLISAGLVFVTMILSKFKTVWTYYAAMVTAALAIAAAIVTIIAGVEMMTKYGQKMMGGIYVAAGAMLIIAAWNALCAAAGNTTATGALQTFFAGAKISLAALG